MRQSELFTKTLKDSPRDEESINAKLLMRAGFVNKESAGVYTFLPLGLKVLRKIEGIIREAMEDVGGQEVLMPVLHPKANWVKTGRWDTVDNLFKIKSLISETEYTLGSTHEEIVVPLVQKFLFSYRDLPFSVFQIQSKFRDEKRAKSGILRGREFLMKDLYSFHRDEEDLDKYYEVVKETYQKIFKSLGLDTVTYLTFASGGTFSQYSHEFQTLTEAGEDIIYICDRCRIAVNKEIITEQNACPECKSTDLREEKAVEVGNIFKLKNKFTKAFSVQYKDEKGKEQDVLMGCYGIGLGRVLGTIVEIFHDEEGILWPRAVAPALVHLLSLEGGELQAEELYEDLQSKGIEVLYDDRRDSTPGQKFADADLIGIPFRVVVSAKTLEQGKVEIKKRSEQEVSFIVRSEVMGYINAP